MIKIKTFKKCIGTLGLALAVVTTAIITSPEDIKAASVSVTHYGETVSEITVFRNNEFSLDLQKGKYYITKIEFSKKGIVEEIEGMEGQGWFVAKKKGVTKITLTCKKGAASCTVRVTDPFKMKLISTKESGKDLEIKIKNNMSKSVKISTKGAQLCYNGDEYGFDTADIKVKKSVTIKPGETKTIVLKNVKQYLDTAYYVSFEATLDKNNLIIASWLGDNIDCVGAWKA
ncbi:MAG: hypothetical protein ACOCNL_01200 [Acetivibrio ethanolgignens]